MAELYGWEDCSTFDIETMHELYSDCVSRSHVEVMRIFGFGRSVADHAWGNIIYTVDGREILDFTAGVGVLGDGHNHPEILEARRNYQRKETMEVHKSFLCPYLAGLSHNIARLLPGNLDVSFFCNSSAEVVEGALKQAYKYHGGERQCVLYAVRSTENAQGWQCHRVI
jgi:putrescine aminotransferase